MRTKIMVVLFFALAIMFAPGYTQAEEQQNVKKQTAVGNKLPQSTGPAVRISGKVLQVLENGLIVKGVSLVADDQKAAAARANSWGSYKGSYVGKDGRYYDDDQTVFVFTSPKSYVDGSDFNVVCFPCGTYSYGNVTGSSSTVKAFKTSK